MSYVQSAIFEIQQVDRVTAARTGRLILPHKNIVIQTPTIWLGHRVHKNTSPGSYFPLPGVLVSAWSILSERFMHRKVPCDILSFLGVREPCPLMVDSGGFQLSKGTASNIDTQEIMAVYRFLNPHISVVLDYPLTPRKPFEQNDERWKKTLENTRVMFREVEDDMVLMPVIHGYSIEAVRRACDDIRQIIENPVVIGVGSLVPLFSNLYDLEILTQAAPNGSMRTYINGFHLACEIVRIVRQEFPNAFLHAFGSGSSIAMFLMFSIGVDSVDSATWDVCAGYRTGYFLNRGIKSRIIRKGDESLMFSNAEGIRKSIMECQCPVCAQYTSLEERINVLRSKKKLLGIHNAWVSVAEMLMFREHIGKESMREFLQSCLTSRYSRRLLPFVFGYI